MLQKRFARAREKTGSVVKEGSAESGKARLKKERPITERIAAAKKQEKRIESGSAPKKPDRPTTADPGAVYTAPVKKKEAAAPVKAAPETAALPIYQRDTYTPAEAYAPGLQGEPEELLWKQGKQLPVEKTPLYTALERVRSGKSLKPTLEEVYTAVALPIYQRDTYTPPMAYAAGGQKVELPRVESGYKRGGLASMARAETDPVEADRREAGALGARLRLGEATDREFDEYLEKIEMCYGYIPAIGSKEEILEEIQSYLRSWQPMVETFAEQRAEGRDPLSRIRNIMAGAAKQYAGSIGSAASTLYQANYENAARYLNEGGEDPELGGMVDPAEYAKRVTERSRSATEAMNGWADGLTQRGAEDIARAQEGLNPAGRMLVNAGAGAAQMAGDAAVAFATGGSAMLPMTVRSFGAKAQEARAKGYSEGQQVLLGLAGAATEYLSERLFGGNPVYDSDVGLINRLVGKIVKNPTVMEVLASAPVETLNEGLEEIVSDLLDPVAEWAVTGNRPEYELDQIIEDGATGVLTALMANGGAKVMKSVIGKQTGIVPENAEGFEEKDSGQIDDFGDTITSGAISGGLNPHGKAADAHAERYYAAVRKMGNDVRRIAKNTGYTESQIQKIKSFLFLDEHDLGEGKIATFDPSYEIAQSWQRLIDGRDIKPHDITLLLHEMLERDLMEQGYSQDEAHRIVSKRYNYKKECEEYYGKIEEYP